MHTQNRKLYTSLIVSNYNWHINVLLDLIDHDEGEANALALLQPVAVHVLKVSLHFVTDMKKNLRYLRLLAAWSC